MPTGAVDNSSSNHYNTNTNLPPGLGLGLGLGLGNLSSSSTAMVQPSQIPSQTPLTSAWGAPPPLKPLNQPPGLAHANPNTSSSTSHDSHGYHQPTPSSLSPESSNIFQQSISQQTFNQQTANDAASAAMRDKVTNVTNALPVTKTELKTNLTLLPVSNCYSHSVMCAKVATLEIEVAGLKAQSLINELG